MIRLSLTFVSGLVVVIFDPPRNPRSIPPGIPRVRPLMKTKSLSAEAMKCRRKFMRFFPGGFRDETYIAWEREYKLETHARWEETLSHRKFQLLLRQRAFAEVAARAVRIEQSSRHSMIFSFEKMALRDAVKSPSGARAFAEGLYDFLHGPGPLESKFERWIGVVSELPRKKTRVLAWPLVTVFGFIAQPHIHMFLKPTVTRIAARKYNFDLRYRSRPSW